MAEEPPNKSPLSRLTGSFVPDSVERAHHLTEDTAQRLIHAFEQSQPVRRIRGSEVATAMLGAVGFALFFVGVERGGSAPDFEPLRIDHCRHCRLIGRRCTHPPAI